MKQKILSSLFTLFSVCIFACTCPSVKGAKGKFAGFERMNNLLNHTFLVEVVSKSNEGVLVAIKNDYKDSTDFKDLFIKNEDQNYTCAHSTNRFKIGERYLITLWSKDELSHEIDLSICYESFINISNNSIKAQIVDKEEFEIKEWSLKDIEEKLNIKI